VTLRIDNAICGSRFRWALSERNSWDYGPLGEDLIGFEWLMDSIVRLLNGIGPSDIGCEEVI